MGAVPLEFRSSLIPQQCIEVVHWFNLHWTALDTVYNGLNGSVVGPLTILSHCVRAIGKNSYEETGHIRDRQTVLRPAERRRQGAIRHEGWLGFRLALHLVVS